MKKYLLLFLLFLGKNNAVCQLSANAIHAGTRHEIQSEVLKEERTFQVYLPKSYSFCGEATFPVLYLMDGDYNFHFMTGLVEMLIESGKIPEMLVVGISDKGMAKYRDYCKPTNDTEKSGKADLFMDFIEKELKPFMAKTYKISGYDIISGHSMGGLFTTNYFLERSKSFDAFVAIDPSLWWNEGALIKRAHIVYENKKKLDAKFFIALANTKGMKIRSFVGVLDNYFPEQEMWSFKYFENDNHGSVALNAIKFALESIFQGWEMTRQKYQKFEDGIELLDYYKNFEKSFGTVFLLPAKLLNNTVFYKIDNKAEMEAIALKIATDFPASLEEFYVQKALVLMEKKQVDKAKNLLEKSLSKYTESYKIYDTLSQVYFELKDYTMARSSSEKAIKIAQALKIRQWTLNEITSNYERTFQ